ncbi:MFS transporter [Solihabitans fulvus]|uniref:MFS transporter n=1 Tax=Solihabitans fulvus TaxID=1892852 RepID=UPI0016621621|nr:MFS transporter [Solihabitans fulvus]
MTTLTNAGTSAGPKRAGLGRDWRRLLAANATSSLSEGALLAALPLLAAHLTRDPRLISGLATAGTLPWLLCSLPIGALVDRLDRRALMIAAQCVRAVLAAAIAGLATAHVAAIWPLYVLAFGIGVADVAFSTANQAMVPNVVDQADLETALGRQIATEGVAREFIGPPLGAALVAFALPLPFWFNAVVFAGAVGLLLRVRTSGLAKRAGRPKRIRTEVAEGLRFLVRHRLLRTLALLAGVGNLCEYMALATLVLFAQEVLRLSDRGVGVLMGSMAVGGVLGGLLSRRLADRFGARRVAMTVQVVIPLSWLAIAIVGRDAVTVAALVAVFSLSVSQWNVIVGALRQRIVPDELRGRLGAAGRLISFGAIPIGSVLGGFVYHSFGPIAPWLVGAAIRSLASLVALPVLRRNL